MTGVAKTLMGKGSGDGLDGGSGDGREVMVLPVVVVICRASR
jgi:hypothetical protein